MMGVFAQAVLFTTQTRLTFDVVLPLWGHRGPRPTPTVHVHHGRLSAREGRVPLTCGSFPPPENRVKYPHFSTCMRRFCHGLSSLFLPVDGGRPGVAVPLAPSGVVYRERRCPPYRTEAHPP